jgi:hypothetical protein
VQEHPVDWVTPDNIKELLGGVTDNSVDVVALDGESAGEIGLETGITFYTKDLYNYYLRYKQVSVGYTCKKHWVANPDEVGYDIILDEITEVNHVAITRAGRGGSSVAVIDSIIGGMKQMRTGLFSYIFKGKQLDSQNTFSSGVFKALEGTGTEEERIQSALDSCSLLKDCAEKSALVDMVRDCFDHKEQALTEKDKIATVMDSLYASVAAKSTEEVTGLLSAKDSTAKEKADNEKDIPHETDSKDKPDDNKGSKEKPDDNKDSTDKPDGNKDSKEKPDDNKDGGCNKDSLSALVAQAVRDSLSKELEGVVTGIVKSTLGIKDDKTPKASGAVIDSDTVAYAQRDYSEFLNI